MKKSKLVRKKQIMVLYHYFLLGRNNRQFANFLQLNSSTRVSTESDSSDPRQNPSWFADFQKREDRILTLVGNNLKEGWRIERIPAFEKAIIASTIYTIEKQKAPEKKQLSLLVNQVVEFSKKYLEKNKCGYINKLLDIVINRTAAATQLLVNKQRTLEVE